MLKQVLYTSGSTRETVADDLDDILAQSRRNNPAIGVTGLLMACDDAYLQVLEGEEVVLGQLLHRIAADPRHRNVMTLMTRDVAQRSFGNWAMGLRRLDPAAPMDRQVFQVTKTALGRQLSAPHSDLLAIIMAFGRDTFVEVD